MKIKFIYTHLIVLIGLIFTFSVSFFIYKLERNTAAFAIKKEVDSTALILSRELNLATDLLSMLQSQKYYSAALDKASFDIIANKLMTQLPYIDSIKWVSFVENKDKITFEQQMSAQQAGFKIKKLDKDKKLQTANKQMFYFPIQFSTIEDKELSNIGLDLSSLNEMSKEITMSWHQGIPLALIESSLQNKLSEQNNFYILFPFFKKSSFSENDRIKNLTGLWLLLIKPNAVFESALANIGNDAIKFVLLESEKDKKDEIVYEHVAKVFTKLIYKKAYSSQPFFFSGQEWKVSGIPSTEHYSAYMTYYPYIIFVLGSIIFLSIGYIMHILQSRTLNIHQRVDERTRELKDVNQKLENLSRIDTLTGHFNRVYFDDIVDAEIKRAQRDELPISLLMIEIDNFTQYTKKYGMSAGDSAIRLIAMALKEALKRPGDMICRYENETFALLLPNTKNGSPIALLCLEAIEKLKIPYDTTKKKGFMTVSIGGVTIVEVDKMNTSQVKVQAKIALSKAIAQGRNRIQWIYAPETNQLDY